MPSNVAWFERLMFIDVAISALIVIIQFSSPAETQTDVDPDALPLDPFVFGIISLALLVGVLVLIWLTVRHRKNWARWTLLAWFVFANLTLLYDILLDQALSDGLFVFILNLVTTALEITAFYLVFTGNAREWFQKPKTV
jgi:hypothetical protein